MDKRPNFVFIMTDTQGANCVGCYNDAALNTPCLDKMAEDGIRFSRAYSTCPVCTPARGGIFTGMYPHINGAWSNDLPLGQSIHTMGERFRELGYHTAYIGKWHLDGHDYFGNGKCPPGWDPEYWYDGLCYLNELTEEQKTLWRTGLGSQSKLEEHAITREFTWANRCSQRAEKFLKSRNPDEPFVLVVSYDEPHGPFTCPPEYVERMKDFKLDLGENAYDDLSTKPDLQRRWSRNSRYHENRNRYVSNPMYFGCNSFVDSEIGSVIQMVEEYGGDNTYVIYTSDHGDMMGAHGISSKGPAIYEEITHIPLIVKTPDKRIGVDDTLVSHVDLIPTMMELAGARVPEILDGKSLVKNLDGQKGDPSTSIKIEFNRFSVDDDNTGAFQPIRAIVKGNLKLVINLMDSDELYDLEKDPGELKNLIMDEEYAEQRNAMHKELIAWMRERRDPFGGYYFAEREFQKLEYPWNGGYIYRPDEPFEVGFRDYMSAQVTNKEGC